MTQIPAGSMFDIMGILPEKITPKNVDNQVALKLIPFFSNDSGGLQMNTE